MALLLTLLRALQRRPRQVGRSMSFDILIPLFEHGLSAAHCRTNPESCSRVGPKPSPERAGCSTVGIEGMMALGALTASSEPFEWAVCGSAFCHQPVGGRLVRSRVWLRHIGAARPLVPGNRGKYIFFGLATYLRFHCSLVRDMPRNVPHATGFRARPATAILSGTGLSFSHLPSVWVAMRWSPISWFLLAAPNGD